MPQVHHIQSATDQYNELVDWIVDCWKIVFPDLNHEYYTVHYMVNMLSKEAEKGVALRDTIVQQALNLLENSEK